MSHIFPSGYGGLLFWKCDGMPWRLECKLVLFPILSQLNFDIGILEVKTIVNTEAK